MTSYFVPKDKRFRRKASENERKSLIIRFFLRQCDNNVIIRLRLVIFFLKKLKRLLVFAVRSRNRCLLSGRAGSVYRHFRLSRIQLKNFSSNVLLPGIRKSSW